MPRYTLTEVVIYVLLGMGCGVVWLAGFYLLIILFGIYGG